MSDIRVMAVSLVCSRVPLMIMATYTNTAFHIASITQLPSSPDLLLAELKALSEKAEKVGAYFVLEDNSGMFKSIGSPIRLDERYGGERPAIVAAMERYTALSSIGAITYPADSAGQLKISGSLYNVRHSDTGKTTYEIDWSRLKDESRVMLLAIYGAMCQTPYHEGYLSRLMSALTSGTKATSSLESLEVIPVEGKESNNTEGLRVIL